MVPMGIPAWTVAGVLPPIAVPDPTSTLRSPYVVRLSEVVDRFGSTDERIAILSGLLRYRAALHAVGLVRGFQWLNGSFVEDIERLEGRPPNDVDVVTFFRLPPGVTEVSVAQRAPHLFPQSRAERQAAKERFHVDAYFERLGVPSERLVDQTAYWYSLWSHRRDHSWKGYLQIDLAPDDDADANTLLIALEVAGAVR